MVSHHEKDAPRDLAIAHAKVAQLAIGEFQPNGAGAKEEVGRMHGNLAGSLLLFTELKSF